MARKWPGQARLVRGNRMRFGRVDQHAVRDLLELTSTETEGFLRLEYGEDDFIEAVAWPGDLEPGSGKRFHLQWRLRGAVAVTAATEPLTLEQAVARFLDFHANRRR